MASAKQGDTVKVHYTGRLQDGTVFDSSLDREPLEFTIGEGMIIPGFEEAVLGMDAGQSRTTHIECGNAYGPRIEEMIQTIGRDQIPNHLQLAIGAQLQVNHPEGGAMILTVTGLTDSEVTLDANHPLAGEDLTFDIELIEIA